MLIEKPLKLEAKNQTSKEHLLVVIATGLLYCIETESISIDDAHAYIFNPFSEQLISQLGVDSELVDIWNHTLFLEDLNPILSQEKFVEKLKKLTVQLNEIARKSKQTGGRTSEWIQNNT